MISTQGFQVYSEATNQRVYQISPQRVDGDKLWLFLFALQFSHKKLRVLKGFCLLDDETRLLKYHQNWKNRSVL